MPDDAAPSVAACLRLAQLGEFDDAFAVMPRYHNASNLTPPREHQSHSAQPQPQRQNAAHTWSTDDAANALLVLLDAYAEAEGGSIATVQAGRLSAAAAASKALLLLSAALPHMASSLTADHWSCLAVFASSLLSSQAVTSPAFLAAARFGAVLVDCGVATHTSRQAAVATPADAQAILADLDGICRSLQHALLHDLLTVALTGHDAAAVASDDDVGDGTLHVASVAAALLVSLRDIAVSASVAASHTGGESGTSHHSTASTGDVVSSAAAAVVAVSVAAVTGTMDAVAAAVRRVSSTGGSPSGGHRAVALLLTAGQTALSSSAALLRRAPPAALSEHTNDIITSAAALSRECAVASAMSGASSIGESTSTAWDRSVRCLRESCRSFLEFLAKAAAASAHTHSHRTDPSLQAACIRFRPVIAAALEACTSSSTARESYASSAADEVPDGMRCSIDAAADCTRGEAVSAPSVPSPCDSLAAYVRAALALNDAGTVDGGALSTENGDDVLGLAASSDAATSSSSNKRKALTLGGGSVSFGSIADLADAVLASLRDVPLSAAPIEQLHLEGLRQAQTSAARAAQLVELARVKSHEARGIDNVDAGALLSFLPVYPEAMDRGRESISRPALRAGYFQAAFEAAFNNYGELCRRHTQQRDGTVTAAAIRRAQSHMSRALRDVSLSARDACVDLVCDALLDEMTTKAADAAEQSMSMLAVVRAPYMELALQALYTEFGQATSRILTRQQANASWLLSDDGVANRPGDSATAEGDRWSAAVIRRLSHPWPTVFSLDASTVKLLAATETLDAATGDATRRQVLAAADDIVAWITAASDASSTTNDNEGHAAGKRTREDDGAEGSLRPEDAEFAERQFAAYDHLFGRAVQCICAQLASTMTELANDANATPAAAPAKADPSATGGASDRFDANGLTRPAALLLDLLVACPLIPRAGWAALLDRIHRTADVTYAQQLFRVLRRLISRRPQVWPGAVSILLSFATSAKRLPRLAAVAELRALLVAYTQSPPQQSSPSAARLQTTALPVAWVVLYALHAIRKLPPLADRVVRASVVASNTRANASGGGGTNSASGADAAAAQLGAHLDRLVSKQLSLYLALLSVDALAVERFPAIFHTFVALGDVVAPSEILGSSAESAATPLGVEGGAVRTIGLFSGFQVAQLALLRSPDFARVVQSMCRVDKRDVLFAALRSMRSAPPRSNALAAHVISIALIELAKLAAGAKQQPTGTAMPVSQKVVSAIATVVVGHAEAMFAESRAATVVEAEQWLRDAAERAEQENGGSESSVGTSHTSAAATAAVNLLAAVAGDATSTGGSLAWTAVGDFRFIAPIAHLLPRTELLTTVLPAAVTLFDRTCDAFSPCKYLADRIVGRALRNALNAQEPFAFDDAQVVPRGLRPCELLSALHRLPHVHPSGGVIALLPTIAGANRTAGALNAAGAAPGGAALTMQPASALLLRQCAAGISWCLRNMTKKLAIAHPDGATDAPLYDTHELCTLLHDLMQQPRPLPPTLTMRTALIAGAKDPKVDLWVRGKTLPDMVKLKLWNASPFAAHAGGAEELWKGLIMYVEQHWPDTCDEILRWPEAVLEETLRAYPRLFDLLVGRASALPTRAKALVAALAPLMAERQTSQLV